MTSMPEREPPTNYRELAPFLEKFRKAHPEPARCAFIMMQFGRSKPYPQIARAIKRVCGRHGITALRADDVEIAGDLLSNVRTCMHGSGFGIAVFDRVSSQYFNPNVSLEVGYMLGLGKPVCFLKDSSLVGLHTDLTGALYRNFDVHRIGQTLPAALQQWMFDRAIILPEDRQPRRKVEKLIQHAMNLRQIRQHEKAVETWKQALELDPAHDEAQVGLAADLSRLGPQHYSKCQKLLTIVISRSPQMAKAYYNRACIGALVSAKPDLSRIFSDLNRAIELDPLHKDYAKLDEDFDHLKSNPVFRRIIGC